jgi:hypothetical protein
MQIEYTYVRDECGEGEEREREGEREKKKKIFQLTKSKFFRLCQLPWKALKIDGQNANGSDETYY